MSDRIHTLPNGVQVQVRDGNGIDIKFPGKDSWLSLTNDLRDSHMIVAFLSIELSPLRGKQ